MVVALLQSHVLVADICELGLHSGTLLSGLLDLLHGGHVMFTVEFELFHDVVKALKMMLMPGVNRLVCNRWIGRRCCIEWSWDVRS